MSDTVYLNGTYLPLAEARVPVLDRGFLFGDGVYEVIPAYAGRLFRLEQHLDRLDHSLVGVRIPNPFDHAGWRAILERLLDPTLPEQSVYLQVTRGVAPKRDHAFPPGLAPTVFAMAMPIAPVDPGANPQGVAAITVDDMRWALCDIKAITLLANVLHKQQAFDRGAIEAILIRDGFAVEGSASNLFIVERGVMVTPPKGHFLLPGITRDLVLELAVEAGLPHREEPVPAARLAGADEVWLTSSTKEIMPVTTLDGRHLGDGRPGPVWRRTMTLYQDYKRRLCAGQLDGR